MVKLQSGILSALLLLPILVRAEIIEGKVVGISGGDAITIEDARGKQHRVKMLGITAAELGTPLGNRSYQRLSDLLYGILVKVEFAGKDNFQRLLGKVLINRRDINLKQIESGLALHEPSESQSPEDRRDYAQAEEKARIAKLGLWRDQSIVHTQPPLTPSFDYSGATLHCKEIRNTLRCDDGSVFTQKGARVYGNDGSVYRKRGNTVFGSDGSTYRQRGPVTYGSDGSICRQRGTLVTCY